MRRGRLLVVLSAAAGLGGTSYALAAAGSTSSTPRASPTPTAPRQLTAAACPQRDLVPTVSRAPGASVTLVPGKPTRLVLCRYSGFGAYPHPVGAWGFHLRAYHLVTARARVEPVARALNALRPVTGSQACPNDDGEALLAIFSYAQLSATDDPVTVHLEGCAEIDNGHLVREAGRPLIQTLLKLIPRLRPHAEPYRLYTHCGIEWTRIRGTYWRAAHPLSDGQGNPPPGWGNPYQRGTLTFTGPVTAVFSAPPGRVVFRHTNRTQPPVICS
jgi:hypothetical protein